MSETTKAVEDVPRNFLETLLRPSIVEAWEAINSEVTLLNDQIKCLKKQIDPIEQRRNRLNSILDHLRHAIDWMPKQVSDCPEEEIPF